MADRCKKCGESFGFFFGKPRERCRECGEDFCPACVQRLPVRVNDFNNDEDSFINAERCLECHTAIQAKIQKVRLTRAKWAAGRDFDKPAFHIASNWYETEEQANFEIRARAVCHDDNCVLQYVLEKKKNWSPPKSNDERMMERLAEEALRDFFSQEFDIELPELRDRMMGYRVSGVCCSATFQRSDSQPRLQPLRQSTSGEAPEHSGEALAYLLERRGLAVSELSAASQIEMDELRAIVEGERPPSAAEAQAIANVLDVEAGDLFEL